MWDIWECGVWGNVGFVRMWGVWRREIVESLGLCGMWESVVREQGIWDCGECGIV